MRSDSGSSMIPLVCKVPGTGAIMSRLPMKKAPRVELMSVLMEASGNLSGFLRTDLNHLMSEYVIEVYQSSSART